MNEKTPAQEARDLLVEILKAADGYEDVAAIDEDGSAQIGFYSEEIGHEFFLTVEPA
jgi:hypothetical protein